MNSTATESTVFDEADSTQDFQLPLELRVTTYQNMPYSGYKEENNTIIGTGYAFQLLDLLKVKLNFTYTIIKPQPDILGGDHSGILGLLYNKEADMAVAFLPIIPDYHDKCSYSTILEDARMTFFMKRPDVSATGTGIFAPFSTTVWLTILASLLVVGPTINFFVIIRSKIWVEKQKGMYTLPQCIWFLYGALLKQGSSASPTGDSVRLLFATWWIFITILSSFYTANLTAFLTKPQFTLSINTISDLVAKRNPWFAQNDRTVELVYNSIHLSGDNPDLVLLKRKSMKRYRFIRDNDYPFTRIYEEINNKKIFIGERHFIKKLMFEDYKRKTKANVAQTKKCTYVISDKDVFVVNRAFAYQRNSTIQSIIDKELTKFVEAGIVSHLKHVDLPIAEICPVNIQTIERRLQNADLRNTYNTVMYGYGSACAFFLFELILKSLERPLRQMKNNCCNKRTKLGGGKTPPPNLPVYSINNNTDYFKRSPPPLYQSTEHKPPLKRQYVNGRDYYVISESNGDPRLIPIRTPSAFLFQYTA